MAKRRSEEARVLAYFKSAPLEKAELMLGLVRDEVKVRIASNVSTSLREPRKPKKLKRTRNASDSPGQAQTSFDPQTMAQ